MKRPSKSAAGPIGVFDSGYGGLTILRSLRKRLPGYDWLYLGDNARAPYGTRSFDLVYEFTLQAVEHLFAEGCRLVVLACNTASAKALRTIQQIDLPRIDPARRVLGVIRPTVEALGEISRSRHVGVLATPGTVKSGSYGMEIGKLFPDMKVTEHAAPMWVPLVECGEAFAPGADYFVKKYVDEIIGMDPEIDTLVLACTHYPILYSKIRAAVPERISIVSQGDLVAASMEDYLERHRDIASACACNGVTNYLTTENPERFNPLARLFMEEKIDARRIQL